MIPRRADKYVKRRRGSLGLAAPLALVALGLLATGLWLGFRDADASNADSWTQGSTGITANIPGWPAVGSPIDVNAGTLPDLTTSTSTSISRGSTTVPPTTSPSTTESIVLHPILEPVRIVIPSIGVDAKLISVGLRDNGDMDVPPFGLAAWYKLGPAPGAAGPAVIVAHVDSKTGPDVFYHLKELKIGEKISVHGRDGDVATFVVEGKEQQLKTKLPVERIWNVTDLPLLRLITCGGQFDRSTGHYLANVIIYAHLSD